MAERKPVDWREKVVDVREVLERIEPGMSIFLGTGVAEPRTLVQGLMAAPMDNLQDLTLIQLVSLGDAISSEALDSRKFRLKTFFAGWVADEAITSGRVDLVPSRFSRIPWLIESGYFQIDAAFVQISTPGEFGYASLGVAVDAARQAMNTASIVVGEVCDQVPVTLGDTFVNIGEFDFLVESSEPPVRLGRWPEAEVFDKIAENLAWVVEDGSCVSFSIGPLYEALGRKLLGKKDLGVHSAFITDALMDLINSGAVTNRRKGFFRGKTLSCYAIGTEALMSWLDKNPTVEMQGVDVVYSPRNIGMNRRFRNIFPARKVDITGGVALQTGKGMVVAGPGDVLDFVEGARLSRGGLAICALPSRNLRGEPNIRVSIEDYPNQISMRDSLDMIVTEYGHASLTGLTVRERAQAIIDIAHPDDREGLVERAKKKRIIYEDQIYLAESGKLYPEDVRSEQTFKDDLVVLFRAIKPSDEEGMRSLFYRFSDKAVYYRYFSPIKTMPHTKMQEYVNIDFNKTMSIVGFVVSATGKRRLICEARYAQSSHSPYVDTAFVVDENYGGRGIATFLLHYLIQIAKQRGIKGFTADVLATNKPMMKVFEKCEYPIKAMLSSGVYELTIPFEKGADDRPGITYKR
ncbi:GNAT family N-acetyltransferase [Thermodesulfobacteriota bacterium]